MLDSLLPEILRVDDYIVVLGDFNIDMMNIVNPIKSMFDSYGFFLVIDEPTRITAHFATLLDPIFVYTRQVLIKSGTLDASELSDHRLTFCVMRIPGYTKTVKHITFRDLKHFNEQ